MQHKLLTFISEFCGEVVTVTVTQQMHRRGGVYNTRNQFAQALKYVCVRNQPELVYMTSTCGQGRY